MPLESQVILNETAIGDTSRGDRVLISQHNKGKLKSNCVEFCIEIIKYPRRTRISF